MSPNPQIGGEGTIRQSAEKVELNMKEVDNIKRLHVGTSGWIYGHWAGILYPDTIKPARYLEYYVTKFSCVELNASFYHLPLKATAEGWIRRTPENFRFRPKLSRFITHQKRLMECEEPVARYFDVFGGMIPRLGHNTGLGFNPKPVVGLSGY